MNGGEKKGSNGRITDLSEYITATSSAWISNIFYVSLKIVKSFLTKKAKFKSVIQALL